MFMGKRLSADGPVKNLWLVEDADEVALKCLDFYKKPLNVKVKLMQVAEPEDSYNVRLCFLK